MFRGWPIRKKLTIGVVILIIAVAILAISGFSNVYSFRGLVRSISRRATELPVAVKLAQHVSALRATIPTRLAPHADRSPIDVSLQSFEFSRHLRDVVITLHQYQARLEENSAETNEHIGNIQQEMKTILEMEDTLKKITSLRNPEDGSWFIDEASHDELVDAVDRLNFRAQDLPSYLQNRMFALQGDVRGSYRTWIVITWITTAVAGLLSFLLIQFFYRWVFRPLRQLIKDSRRVAGGDFDHRIHLNSGDEMDELATAMNDMTERFQQIKEDLDEQVQERTREVIRGEQLASVGFLAAGVAHEINNPLASIALCAESLEERISDLLNRISIEADESQEVIGDSDDSAEVVNDYLRMIQREAFRCKGITERLLDFSRLGDVERHSSDLTELVQNVVDMVQHVGKYKRKTIEFNEHEPIFAHINAQEIKQVVLNLITNGLESLAPDGTVQIAIKQTQRHAILQVVDNGCGLTEEVRAHLFEPFFTRRHDGQGTGLGMSITYRIINEHGGEIDVSSDGLNQGTTVVVRLPVEPCESNTEVPSGAKDGNKEKRYYRAA